MIKMIYFHRHSSFYNIIYILYNIWKYNIYFRILKYLSRSKTSIQLKFEEFLKKSFVLFIYTCPDPNKFSKKGHQ